MRRTSLITSLVVGVLLTGTRVGHAEEATARRQPSIQIAILLDTSNSMDGLIAQAKTQLWTIVNEFIKARRFGRPPEIEVALFEYGNDRLAPQEGFIRLVLPLTDDLDKVSEELFSLKTNGGSEFCGQVIQNAVNGLSWSTSRDVYKAIFIAGNEPFSQGTVDYHESCRAAISKRILVNTIFCGPIAEGEQTGWKTGALLADGQFLSIDHNKQTVQIATPHDAELVRLNSDLNSTYIPYGKLGESGQARQVAQDANANNVSAGTLASRTRSKSTTFYCVDDWDLIDAIRTGKCTIESLKDDDLPASLRSKSLTARKAFIEETRRKRESVQAEIVKANAEREKFIMKEQAKQAREDKDTLDTALIRAIRTQAAAMKFTFK